MRLLGDVDGGAVALGDQHVERVCPPRLVQQDQRLVMPAERGARWRRRRGDAGARSTGSCTFAIDRAKLEDGAKATFDCGDLNLST